MDGVGLRVEQLPVGGGGRPGLVAQALSPGRDVGPALRRAFDADVPYLVNVATDPEVAYPRSTSGL